MSSAGKNDKPVRLLILAEDGLTRMGLAALLESAAGIEVVGQSGGLDELDAALDAFQPAVILWDATRVGVDWVNAEATSAFPDDSPPVLALRRRHDTGGTLWFEGVRGVLSREASSAQIEAAVIAVARGLVVTLPGDLPRQVKRGTRSGQDQVESLQVESLTVREMEVLQLLAEGLANKEIARRMTLSENTVKFHVNAILGKLGATSRTDAVVRASRAGLLLL